MNLIFYGYDQNSVEKYLIYKVWLVNLALNIIIFFILIAQYVGRFDISLIFFRMNYLEDKPYMAIQFFYPSLIVPFLLIISLVYAAILFGLRSKAFHRDPANSAAAMGLPPDQRRGPDKPIQIYLAAIVFTFALSFMWALPLLVSSYRYLLPFLPDFEQPTFKTLMLLLGFYIASYQMAVGMTINAYIYGTHLFVQKYVFHKKS